MPSPTGTAELLKVVLDNVGEEFLAFEAPELAAWGIEKRAGRWLVRGVAALVWGAGGEGDADGGSLNTNTNDRSDSRYGSIGAVTG